MQDNSAIRIPALKGGGLLTRIKITSNILFVAWFGIIIILDKIGRIFDISAYTMNFILLIISGIILYAIYKINMNDKKNKGHYAVEYTIKKKERILAKDEEDVKIKVVEGYKHHPEITFTSIKKIDETGMK